MGMKKKAEVPAIPDIPAVPSAVKTVQAVEQVKAEKAGDDKILSTPRPKVLSDYQKPWLPEEIRRNDIKELVVNSISSPVVAQMSVGRNDAEVLQTITKVFEHALALFERHK